MVFAVHACLVDDAWRVQAHSRALTSVMFRMLIYLSPCVTIIYAPLISHPNIVRLLEIYESPARDTVSLIMELCTGGKCYLQLTYSAYFTL
jgi:serine/threonine protein kinase